MPRRKPHVETGWAILKTPENGEKPYFIMPFYYKKADADDAKKDFAAFSGTRRVVAVRVSEIRKKK